MKHLKNFKSHLENKDNFETIYNGMSNIEFDRFYDFYSENFEEDFHDKWKEGRNLFKHFNKVFVFEKYKEIVSSLLELHPSYLKFDLTDDSSIFFQSNINSFNVYLELYFDQELKEGFQTVLNIYKDKKPILVYDGSIRDCIKKIANKTSISTKLKT